MVNINKIVDIWSTFLKGSTFYLPIARSVYIGDNDIKELLFDILNNANTDKFLEYDIYKQWFDKKQDIIDIENILINNKEVMIPVIDNFRKILKIYYYSNTNIDIDKLNNIKKSYNNVSKIICFNKPNISIKYETYNTYYKKITKDDILTKDFDDIIEYNNLSENNKKTFLDFSKELNEFYVLYNEFILKNKIKKPIFCAIKNNKIIGAIGPLNIFKDKYGINFFSISYFGVKKEFRKHGIGNKLWKRAMDYFYLNNIKYSLVQNTPESPAIKFYKKQGLNKNNTVYKINIKNVKFSCIFRSTRI